MLEPIHCLLLFCQLLFTLFLTEPCGKFPLLRELWWHLSDMIKIWSVWVYTSFPACLCTKGYAFAGGILNAHLQSCHFKVIINVAKACSEPVWWAEMLLSSPDLIKCWNSYTPPQLFWCLKRCGTGGPLEHFKMVEIVSLWQLQECLIWPILCSNETIRW